MVHLGYEAAALERKGIKTERGNHNREVQKRNLNRLAEGVASGVRNPNLELVRPHAANAERAPKKWSIKKKSQKNPMYSAKLSS